MSYTFDVECVVTMPADYGESDDSDAQKCVSSIALTTSVRDLPLGLDVDETISAMASFCVDASPNQMRTNDEIESTLEVFYDDEATPEYSFSGLKELVLTDDLSISKMLGWIADTFDEAVFGDDDATEMSPAPSPGSAASVVTTATVASAVVLTGLHCDDYDAAAEAVFKASIVEVMNDYVDSAADISNTTCKAYTGRRQRSRALLTSSSTIGFELSIDMEASGYDSSATDALTTDVSASLTTAVSSGTLHSTIQANDVDGSALASASVDEDASTTAIAETTELTGTSVTSSTATPPTFAPTSFMIGQVSAAATSAVRPTFPLMVLTVVGLALLPVVL
jgi:hypothetical protein